MTQYLAQYKAIEERITERNNRLKEMDRCVNEHQSLQGKPEIDPTRVQIVSVQFDSYAGNLDCNFVIFFQAKEKAEYKSRAYKDLNEELKRDIPKLLEGRTFFLDALFSVVSIFVSFFDVVDGWINNTVLHFLLLVCVWTS